MLTTIYPAIFGVLGFATGTVIGSQVMRLLKLEGRRAAAYVALCSLIAAVLSMTQMTLGCRSIVNTVGYQGE